MSEDSEKGKYMNPKGSATWEYLATMSCSLLIFCVGCISGWNSPSFTILLSPASPVTLTASDISSLASMVAVGHAIAPIFTIVMAHKLGRKNSLLAVGIPAIISWALISITQRVMILFVARFISGLSVGLVYCFPQMYLGEIASPKLRGAISMVCGTMMNAGILFMFVVAPYFSVQTMAGISMSIATISVITIWFIPESPYFLAMVGKFDEAEGALEKLRGKTDVSEELDLIKITVSQKCKAPEGPTRKGERTTLEPFSAFRRLFTVAGNRKALMINFLFVAVLQFGSYMPMMAFGQLIFERMNIGISGHVCAMIMAAIQIVFNILTTFIIDRLGRRPLICISGLLSGAFLLTLSGYSYLMDYTEIDVTQYRMVALCASFANMIALNIGLMPLQHVIQSEILVSDVKELASCIIGVGGGVMGIIGLKSYIWLSETCNFGHSLPFLGFAANTWTFTALILKLLPETRGKTLFQIQKDLNP